MKTFKLIKTGINYYSSISWQSQDHLTRKILISLDISSSRLLNAKKYGNQLHDIKVNVVLSSYMGTQLLKIRQTEILNAPNQMQQTKMKLFYLTNKYAHQLLKPT